MIINNRQVVGGCRVGGERPQTGPPSPLIHVSPAALTILIKIISMLINFYGKLLFQSQTIKLIDSFGHFFSSI